MLTIVIIYRFFVKGKIVHGGRTMLKDYLLFRKSPLFLFFILILLIIFWFVVYLMNGTSTVFTFLFLLPILLTTYHLGLIPGVIVAIISGILLGPFMYLDVASQIPQTTYNWLLRTMFFIIIAVISGIFTGRLKRLVYHD